MTEAERIDAIEQWSRTYHRHLPEALVQAVVHYLKGEGALARARQEWQAARKSGFVYPFFIHLSPDETLDALDLRILDLCITTNLVVSFLGAVSEQKRINQAVDYLLSQGIEQRQILTWMLGLLHSTVDSQGNVTALGQYILSYLPEQTDELLKAVAAAEHLAYFWHLSDFIKLLVKAQPPYLDLAWQLVQQQEQAEQEEHRYTYGLGICVQMLLEADPARFTAWARKVASSSSPENEYERVQALQALMKQDPARHIDLAVAAARTPPPDYWKNSYAVAQCAGLEAAIAFDSAKYWPLLEEAADSQNYYLSGQAVKLLAGFSFDQARPALQRCVASAEHRSASKALDRLLQQQWDGQQAYALSLLAHRSKQVRKRVSAWLATRGEAAIEDIAPFLSHRSADARLAAVQTLGRIGSERAKSLVAARLGDKEKAPRVRAAILDVVSIEEALLQGIGIPAARENLLITGAHSPEAIIAEAGVTLSYISRPVLAWFDAQAAPALAWTTGAAVPPEVLSYLLYRQSRVPRKDTLSPQVSQALALIDRSASGDLALALYRGWVRNGAKSAESWLLPLACALADDRLAPLLSRQIEKWALGTRRTLAVQGIRALALIESDAALAELKGLAGQFTHGRLKATIKEALAVAAGR